jgi:hypothetical protein
MDWGGTFEPLKNDYRLVLAKAATNEQVRCIAPRQHPMFCFGL